MNLDEAQSVSDLLNEIRHQESRVVLAEQHLEAIEKKSYGIELTFGFWRPKLKGEESRTAMGIWKTTPVDWPEELLKEKFAEFVVREKQKLAELMARMEEK